MTDPGFMPHLESAEVAAYIDRTLAQADRTRLEAHLAECRECREELVALSRLLRVRDRPRRVWLPLAAAAAILVLVVPWRRLVGPGLAGNEPPLMREPASTSAVAPLPILQRGPAGGPRFVWSSVPGADRYRITVFTSDGRVAWETQLAETTVTLPDSVAATSGRYFWKVEARVGFERWVSSDLTEFLPPRRSR